MNNNKLKEMVENNPLVKKFENKSEMTIHELKEKYPFISKRSVELLREHEKCISNLLRMMTKVNYDREILESMNISGDSIIGYFYNKLFIRANNKNYIEYPYIKIWSGEDHTLLSISMNCVEDKGIQKERLLLSIINKDDNDVLSFIHEGPWLENLNNMIEYDLGIYQECEDAIQLYMEIKDRIGSVKEHEDELEDYKKFDDLFKK